MNYQPIDKNQHDVSKIFSTFVTFLGDADKTALALEIDSAIVRNLAVAENWSAKLKQWNEVVDGDPKTTQIQINRAVCFVQAHRLRTVLDKVVGKLHAMSPDELVAALTVETKHGPEFKTRALTDLIKGAEAVQLMSMRSLGDTADERP